MAKLKPRELKDMEIGEVSLVDKAANKKKFLFFKQEDDKAKPKSKKLKKKLNIVIDSDGTVGGTKIALNGDEIEKMKDFSFSFWTGSDMDSPVSCHYSKEVENDDGFSRSETFQLSKGEHIMNEEIKKQVEAYFGENQTVDFEKAVEDDVIIKSLETVISYHEDSPDDLRKAIGTLATQAALYSPVKVEKSDNEDGNGNATDIEKAGAKLSKDTMKKLTDALSALKSLLPEIKQNVEKSDNDKAIEELQKTIESLEKKSETDDADKSTKLLEDLAKRLATVEKNAGVKKGLDGQEANSGNESSSAKWPSLLESGE